MNVLPISTNEQNNSPNFGMLYSPKTVRTLKKIVPELVKEEGVESTKLAIATLKKLGQRKDNIKLHLEHDGGHCYSLSTGVNKVKDRDFDGYIYYIDHPSCLEVASRSRTGFQDYVKTLDTDKFVNAAHSGIDEYANKVKGETFKEKVANKALQAKEAIVDGFEWLIDEFSLVDYQDGEKTKTTIVAWSDLKDCISGMFNSAKASKDNDITLLRKEIDGLPTRL